MSSMSALFASRSAADTGGGGCGGRGEAAARSCVVHGADDDPVCLIEAPVSTTATRCDSRNLPASEVVTGEGLVTGIAGASAHPNVTGPAAGPSDEAARPYPGGSGGLLFARLLFELPRICPGNGGKLAVDETDARKPGPQRVDAGGVASGCRPIDAAIVAADRVLDWPPLSLLLPPLRPPSSTTFTVAASAGVGAESHIVGSICCAWAISCGVRIASVGSRSSISPLRLPAPR